MSQLCVNGCHVSNDFEAINKILQFEHISLLQDPNPIKTVMEFNDGYYFLPVFYTLCKHFEKHFMCLVDHLYSFIDTKFHPLLVKLRILNPDIIECISSDMTLDTLHFCVESQRFARYNYKRLKSIVENYRQRILSVTTSDQMVHLVTDIQRRHSPLKILVNGLRRPSRYIWTGERWWYIKNERPIKYEVSDIWNSANQIYNEYNELPGESNEKMFSDVMFHVLSSVHRVEPKKMDAHKWLLRVPGGDVLDLLTGHVGGEVPEFNFSKRLLTQEIPRADLNLLCNEAAPDLEFLYDTLTDQKTFSLFVSNLMEKNSFDMINTLRAIVPNTNDFGLSMLHFYVNLCKWTSFDYDLLMYLLDVLASVYLGTNYEKKIFVFKGYIYNGKTTLLEMMEQLLGGYYQRIKPHDHLSLKLTLFSCRLGAVDKVDNNRLKYIMDNTFGDSAIIPFTKFFVTTNKYHKIPRDMEHHVVVVPFKSFFIVTASTYTSDQIKKNMFPSCNYETVVNPSLQGCFLMLYYHLKKNMSSDDGLLHYRNQPNCVIEETNKYLKIAGHYKY